MYVAALCQRLSAAPLDHVDHARGIMTNVEDSRSMRRSALVIGASGDIGRAVCELLMLQDYRLTLTYFSEKLSQNLMVSNNKATWVKLDVSDSNAVREVIDQAEKRNGSPYCLIYCAGILRDSPILLTSDEVWRAVLDINLTGAFYCVRAIARSMMVEGRGRIVLLGSIAGHTGNLGQSAYSTAKSGLEAFCRVAAAELGRYNITCNVVAPGAIESKMVSTVKRSVVKRILDSTPLRRLGDCKDIANLIGYLLTDEAAFITGQSLLVDGGLSVRFG
jgi:NAD(P)-dependent dehydrogenase (short-subunit alcohol dehydrogenase family)